MKTENNKPKTIQQDGERFKGGFFRRLSESEAVNWGARVGYAASTMRAVWKQANGHSVKVSNTEVEKPTADARKYAKNKNLDQLKQEAKSLDISFDEGISKAALSELIMAAKEN